MNTIGLTRGTYTKFVQVESYPDGSPRVDSTGLFHDWDAITLKPKNMHELMTGLFLADALAYRGKRVKRLVLPFVPAARQDRLNDSGDFLFTLKSMAEMINARGFEDVVMLDPHSMVAPALINNARVVSIVDIMRPDPTKPHSTQYAGWDGVIAPDAGAAKRAFDVAQFLGVPFYQGEKHRDVATGKLSGFNVDLPYSSAQFPINNRRFLVVDDICDGGGTFNGLARSVFDHEDDSITLDLWVTHGVFSQGTDKLLDNYENIFTTDSTIFDKGNASVRPVTERLVNW